MLLAHIVTVAVVGATLAVGERAYVAQMDSVMNSRDGAWGEWQYCPNGTFAGGFQLNIDTKDDGDRSGLNAISLFCNEINTDHIYGSISSTADGFGTIQSPQYCNGGFIVGFALRSMITRYNDDDNVGAINFKAVCSNDNKTMVGMPYALDKIGNYSQIQMCNNASAVCGIQTQVGPHDDSADDTDRTALNNVNLRCCHVDMPDIKCNASDAWVTAQACDNTGGSTNITCSLETTIGSKKSTSQGGSGHWSNHNEIEVGLSMGAQYGWFSAKMDASVGVSKDTGKDWSHTSSQEFSEQTKFTVATTNIPPGVNYILEQVVGSCGPFTVNSMTYRIRSHHGNKTTVGPVKTTHAAGKTTAAPAKTTAAPAKTTAAPANTTAAPAKTTAAPAKTTAAPAKSTAAPAKTTKKAKKMSHALHKTNDAPKMPTHDPELLTLDQIRRKLVRKG